MSGNEGGSPCQILKSFLLKQYEVARPMEAKKNPETNQSTDGNAQPDEVPSKTQLKWTKDGLID